MQGSKVNELAGKLKVWREMAVFTENQRKLSRKLITVLTGFRPKEENFKICFNFCKSNFKFHCFLSVNDIKIRRDIEGLVEKFHIHSQPEKADALGNLTDLFLSGNLEHSYSRSDAHYAILSLLLCMSHSPIHSTFDPPTPISPPPDDEVDGFDWSSYLMEGIEYLSDDQRSGTPWSLSDTEYRAVDLDSDLSDSAVGDECSDEGSIHDEIADSKSWLKEHVSFQYWENRCQTHQLPKPARSAHPSCELAEKWQCHVISSSPFQHTPGKSLFLSESQIVRETIWLLLGAEQSFVYSISADHIQVKDGICMFHLTPLALLSILEEFVAMATKLRKMRRFCRVVMEGGMEYVRCRTYEAFISGHQESLQEILVGITQVEVELLQNKKVVTLLKLLGETKVTFDLVNALYEIFDVGIFPIHQQQLPRPTARECSVRLLNSLWACLEHYDIMGKSCDHLLRVVYPLWIKVLRPYMDMLDSWMTDGYLTNTFNEFSIIRTESLEMKAPNYWTECFVVSGETTPTFLRPMMSHILLAGKSMHLIESIGKFKHLQEGVAQSSPSKGRVSRTSSGIYEEFLESIMKLKPSCALVGSCDRSCDEDNESHDEDDNVVPEKEEGGERGGAYGHPHFDPLVNFYLQSMDNPLVTHINPLTTHVINPIRPPDNEGLMEILQERSMSLTILIQKSVAPLIRRRYRTASGALIQLLRSEFNLSDHVRVMQLYFLMEEGPTIHQLTDDIFRRVLSGDEWEETSYLNAILEEALQSSHSQNYQHLKKRFSLSLPPGSTSPSSLILHYSVPWPLDLLFSDHVMETYNCIFQLLLHVRWAMWNLEGVAVRTSSMQGMEKDVAHKIHLLFLLRTRLLYFVNCLSNYFMTRVLHSVGVEFRQDIAMATDLEEILGLHSMYLHTIYDRCFLNKKAAMVHQAIMNALGLALQFRRSWERGVAHFAVSEAGEMEAEFMRCCQFMISCLNRTVARGSCPHLETLAFSLQSLKKGEQIFPIK